jgi:hypothetical protein
MFINELSTNIHFSEFLLFADDLKIVLIIKSVEDCKLIKSDTDFVKK